MADRRKPGQSQLDYLWTTFKDYAVSGRMEDSPRDYIPTQSLVDKLLKDHSIELFKVVESLPEEGEENKIYLVQSGTDHAAYAFVGSLPILIGNVGGDLELQNKVDELEGKITDLEDNTITGQNAITTTNTDGDTIIKLKLDNTGNVVLSQSNTGLKAQVPVDGINSTDTILTLTDKKLSTTLNFTYDEASKKIKLTGVGGVIIGEIDTTDFLIDGMLSGVSFDETTHILTLTFNADSGQEPIEIDLSKLVDVYDGSNIRLKNIEIPTTNAVEPAANDTLDLAVSNLVKKDRELRTAIDRITADSYTKEETDELISNTTKLPILYYGEDITEEQKTHNRITAQNLSRTLVELRLSDESRFNIAQYDARLGSLFYISADPKTATTRPASVITFDIGLLTRDGILSDGPEYDLASYELIGYMQQALTPIVPVSLNVSPGEVETYRQQNQESIMQLRRKSQHTIVELYQIRTSSSSGIEMGMSRIGVLGMYYPEVKQIQWIVPAAKEVKIIDVASLTGDEAEIPVSSVPIKDFIGLDQVGNTVTLEQLNESVPPTLEDGTYTVLDELGQNIATLTACRVKDGSTSRSYYRLIGKVARKCDIDSTSSDTSLQFSGHNLGYFVYEAVKHVEGNYPVYSWQLTPVHTKIDLDDIPETRPGKEGVVKRFGVYPASVLNQSSSDLQSAVRLYSGYGVIEGDDSDNGKYMPRIGLTVRAYDPVNINTPELTNDNHSLITARAVKMIKDNLEATINDKTEPPIIYYADPDKGDSLTTDQKLHNQSVAYELYSNYQNNLGRVIKVVTLYDGIKMSQLGVLSDEGIKMESPTEYVVYLLADPETGETQVIQTTLKEVLELDQVNNTSDLDKPISTATQTALDTKADKADLDKVEDTVNQLVTIGSVEYVDLGLPSGLLWATCNLGASTSEEAGDMSYRFTSSDDFDTDENVKLEKDPAHLAYGGDWRMPSEDDYLELNTYCTCKIKQENNRSILEVTSKSNGNILRIPANNAQTNPSTGRPFWNINTITRDKISNTGDSVNLQGIQVNFSPPSTYSLSSVLYTGFGAFIRPVTTNPINSNKLIAISKIDSYTVNGKEIINNPTLSKSDIGLANVDNTSDLNKPISTATQAALDSKVNTSDLDNYKTTVNTNLETKANISDLSNVLAEDVVDGDTLAGVDIIHRDTLKKDLFIDLWNTAAGYFGSYNSNTGYFELNGLTDITYEEALDIFIASMPYMNIKINANAADSYNACIKPRTYFNLCLQDGKVDFSYNQKLEVLNFCPYCRPGKNGFNWYNNNNIRKIIVSSNSRFGINTGSVIAYNSITFNNLPSLEDVHIKLYNTDVPIKDSPNLTFESVKYLVDNSQNTEAVTVTVHPDVYAKLTDTSNTEWNQVMQDAVAKQITFATAS